MQLQPHNRWGGLKVMREKWQSHIDAALFRPVMVVDEAQEMQTSVLNELRLMCSTQLDSHLLLTTVLAGGGRLVERLHSDELLPLGSRMRVRLSLERATPEEMLETERLAASASASPDGDAAQLAGLLRDWIADGLFSGVILPPPGGRLSEMAGEVVERPLVERERTALARISAAAQQALGLPANATPAEVVRSIVAFVGSVRDGKSAPPEDADLEWGLATLYGDQVRAAAPKEWGWVHVTLVPEDWKSFALVSDDRAYVCFPLELRFHMRPEHQAANWMLLFNMLAAGKLPPAKPGDYMKLG